MVTEEIKSMAKKDGKRRWVIVNRAPVVTLWAAVVAEVLGFEHDEALTLGRAMAGGESETMLARLSSLLSL